MAAGEARRIIRIERVADTLPAGVATLRAEARASGYIMLDRLTNDWASGANRFQRPGEVLLAAYAGDAFAGVGGLTAEVALPGAFRMRRFYVLAAFRRLGVAREIARTLLCGAGDRIVTVNAAAGSEVFWEALGFRHDRRASWTHVRP